MASKRVIVLFFVLLLALGAVFASTALASSIYADSAGGSRFLEVSTSHFKVIYEPECAATAKVIADGCEDEYLWLCSFFGVDPDIVIPVYITSSYKVLNAYYTPYPSNRIVMFDTVADNDGLAVFPNTLLYIFRHELTHAFTMNIRSGFWRFVSGIFGDWVSVSPTLYAYDSLVEGVAVLSESVDGYGRLNDLRSTRVLRQAKLEGCFPSWIDIAGAMDVYPSSNLPYVFGGAFLGYLYSKSGADVVGEIFRRFGHVNWFQSTAAVIEDCVGVPFEKLWDGFHDSIEVPSSFVQASYVDAFDSRCKIKDIAVGRDGRGYLLDRASSGVYGLEAAFGSEEGCEEGDGESEVVSSCRRLFSVATYGQGLCVSSRGEIMVPYVSKGKSCVRIYDCNGNVLRSFGFEDRDVRDGCFVDLGSSNYVLLYTARGQETCLELCNEDGDVVSFVDLASGSVASGFSCLDGGRVAFILTNGGVDGIAVLEIAEASETFEMSLLVSKLPEGIRLASMSQGFDEAGSEVISFCWFPPASSLMDGVGVNDIPILGGYGEFSLDDWSIRLSYGNVSGGINNPVRLGDLVLFSASLYDGDRLCSASVNDLLLDECLGLELLEALDPQPLDVVGFVKEAKPYTPIANVGRGSLLPFGVYGPLSNANDIGLGLTWYSLDPTSTVAITASGAYSPNGPFVWADLSWKGLFDVGVGAKAILDCQNRDLDAYMFTFHTGARLDFDIGNERSVAIEDSFFANWLCILDTGWTKGLSNTFSATYSYGISTGLGKTDVFGYAFGFGLSDWDPALSAVLVVPRLLPIRCDGAFAYNLPLRIECGVGYSFGMEDVVLAGSAKVTVLSYEIQRGVRLLGLYFRRAVLDAKYNASYRVLAEDFGHSLEFQAFVELSPVLGQYLTGVGVGVGAKLSWNFVDPLRVEFAFSLK